jgi:hypothetical protein
MTQRGCKIQTMRNNEWQSSQFLQQINSNLKKDGKSEENENYKFEKHPYETY